MRFKHGRGSFKILDTSKYMQEVPFSDGTQKQLDKMTDFFRALHQEYTIYYQITKSRSWFTIHTNHIVDILLTY